MTTSLLQGATVASTGDAVPGGKISSISLQGVVTGQGAVTAKAVIEGTNNGLDWLPIATLNMAGPGRGTDGGAVEVPPWAQIRARLTDISGTSASVDVLAVFRGVPYGS